MVDNKNESLLFTKDGWSIYKGEYLRAGERGQVLAYVYHQACPDLAHNKEIVGDPTDCWHTGDWKQRCLLCHEDVPEGIQALVVMYQWET